MHSLTSFSLVYFVPVTAVYNNITKNNYCSWYSQTTLSKNSHKHKEWRVVIKFSDKILKWVLRRCSWLNDSNWVIVFIFLYRQVCVSISPHPSSGSLVQIFTWIYSLASKIITQFCHGWLNYIHIWLLSVLIGEWVQSLVVWKAPCKLN